MLLLSSRGYCVTAAMSFAFVLPAAAQAQSIEEFYRGKQLNMVIGYPTGGSNDIYARAVARHIGKHIPGNPTVIPRNMPGGGSLIAANHVFNVAPKDGTTLSLIAPTIPLEERLGVANVKLKTAEFNWIGRVAPSVNMTFVMANVPVKTIQDTFKREMLLGASARSSTVAIYPAVVAQCDRGEVQAGDGLSELDRLHAGDGARRGRRPFDQPRGRARDPSGMAAREEDHAAGAVCAQPPSGAAERADVLGARRRTRIDRQILRIVANATEVGKMMLSTPDTPGRPHPGAAPRLRRDDEGPGVPGRAEGAARRARADAGRGAAEARRRARRRIAGDHRQGEGDLSAELMGIGMLRLFGIALAAVILLLPEAPLRNPSRISIAARPSV